MNQDPPSKGRLTMSMEITEDMIDRACCVIPWALDEQTRNFIRKILSAALSPPENTEEICGELQDGA